MVARESREVATIATPFKRLNGKLVNEPLSNSTSRIDRFTEQYRFLSNFYLSPVSDDFGVVFPSIEHAFQAAKATRDKDRDAIRLAATPMKAKQRGSKVQLPRDWEKRKLSVMRSLLRRKFAPGTELAAMLLATGDAVLIEGNDWGDDFWGQCNGAGRNHLGRMLMETRDELRGNSQTTDDPPE